MEIVNVSLEEVLTPFEIRNYPMDSQINNDHNKNTALNFKNELAGKKFEEFYCWKLKLSSHRIKRNNNHDF